MKLFSFVCIFISLLFLTILSTNAFDFTDILGDSIPKIRYCQGDECGIQIGIDAVEGGLDGLETDRSASEYIQSIIVYLLSFISLIAVIYIIYAGFQILIGRGEEEKLKTQKQTIIYVIIGIVVIWLAWPITNFIFDVLNA